MHEAAKYGTQHFQHYDPSTTVDACALEKNELAVAIFWPKTLKGEAASTSNDVNSVPSSRATQARTSVALSESTKQSLISLHNQAKTGAVQKWGSNQTHHPAKITVNLD